MSVGRILVQFIRPTCSAVSGIRAGHVVVELHLTGGAGSTKLQAEHIRCGSSGTEALVHIEELICEHTAISMRNECQVEGERERGEREERKRGGGKGGRERRRKGGGEREEREEKERGGGGKERVREGGREGEGERERGEGGGGGGRESEQEREGERGR